MSFLEKVALTSGAVLVAFALACGGGGGDTEDECSLNSDCPSGERCELGNCVAPDAGTNGGSDDSGGGSAQYERPDQSKDVISDAKLESLENLGVTIYDGTNPPDIEYEFYADNLEQTYDESKGGEVSGSSCPRYLNFSSTGEPYQYNLDIDLQGGCSGGEEGLASFISGQDSCFTVYYESEGSFDGCRYTRTSVISGCLNADEHIQDFVLATVDSDFQDAKCDELVEQGRTSDEGDWRIRKATDPVEHTSN